jgi:hypothetical protein
MLTLLRFWTQIASAAAAAMLVGLIAWNLHGWDMRRIEAKNARAMEAQAYALHKQCSEDKQITTEVSHDYQTQLADLAAQLAAVKRVRPSACVPVARPTTGRDAANGAGHAEGNAVNSDTLFDYAGTAEKYRRQLNACQNFITKTWETKGK